MSLLRNQDGQDDAFKLLFQGYFHRIVRFFANRGFSYDDSLDLTQETFLRVFRYGGGFRGEASPRNWLYQIATNVGKNEWRRRGTSKRKAQLTPVEVAVDVYASEYGLWPGAGEAAHVEAVFAGERLAAARAAILELPPRMRQCLLLFCFHEMSYNEIADVMKISLDTVRSQIRDGRERVKARVAELTGHTGGPRDLGPDASPRPRPDNA